MSNDGNLPVKRQTRDLVELHENGLRAGSLIDQSLAHLTEEQARNLMAKAAEKGLELEVTIREYERDYDHGTKMLERHIGRFQ